MRFLSWLLAALVVSLTLSGCLGGGDQVDPEGDQDGEAPTPGGGEVRGRVFTMADLTPLEGALVRLVRGGENVAEATTDADGDYRLRGIAPGDYRLQATGACCRDEVKDVEVRAGEAAVVNIGLEFLPRGVVRVPFVDTNGQWEGFINCGLAVDDVGPIYPPGCQEGDHSVRHIIFFEPGVRTITVHVDWDPAEGLGAEEIVLTVHNLNAKFALIGETQGPPPLEVQIQNLDLEDEERFDNFDEAGWVGRIAVTPVSDSASLVWQQRLTVLYHVHYWEAGPPDHSAGPGGAGGQGDANPGFVAPFPNFMRDEHEPNPYQEGPGSDCLDYNVLYLAPTPHSPLAQFVDLEPESGYVIDSSTGLAFVDFFDKDGEWITWSNLNRWGNVPEKADYAILCIGMIGEYPDVPEIFAHWFFMDGFPAFES